MDPILSVKSMKSTGRISLGLVLLSLLCTTVTPSAAHIDSTAPPLLVLNIRGDTIDLAEHYSGRNLYIILYNHYACKDCFASLDSALRIIHDSDSLLSIIALLRVGDGIYLKRSALSGARKALPHVQDFYFDCRAASLDDPWPPKDLKGGLFGHYNTSKTPSLVYMSEHTLRYLSYEDITEPLIMQNVPDRVNLLRGILGR